jgi:pSer/pThr/pTyr-binding forkhead associated (FHA) protein
VSIKTAIEPGQARPFATLEGPTGKVMPVAINRCVIGRSSTADVHIANDDVSRQHALLWREAGAVWLVDLDSSNGTLVNGQPIDDVIDLIDGDSLTFGGITYRLRIL